MDKDHSIEDDYTPVKIYFRGDDHTAAAEHFMRLIAERDGGRLADMLAEGDHAVTNSDIDFEGRGVTIVVGAHK